MIVLKKFRGPILYWSPYLVKLDKILVGIAATSLTVAATTPAQMLLSVLSQQRILL